MVEWDPWYETGLVISVCMIFARRMEGLLHDRGSTYGALYAWCGVVEFLMVHAREDVLIAAFLICSLC